MIYFDTNILIYATIKQDIIKYNQSNNMIKEAILKDKFCISPLVFSEYIFTLSKLKIIEECSDIINFYEKYIKFCIDENSVLEAYNKCHKFGKCRNINDFIHLEIANKYCKKLITFDSDFKNLQNNYDVEIEIIRS